MYCPERKTGQRQRKTGRQTDRKTDRQSDRHLDRHIGKKRTRKYKTTGHAFKFTDLVVSCIGQRARKGHSSRQTEPLRVSEVFGAAAMPTINERQSSVGAAVCCECSIQLSSFIISNA